MRLPDLMAGNRFPAILFLVAILCFCPSPAKARQNPVSVLAVNLAASISPAQADMLDEAIGKAREMGAAFLLVRLDTPGGGIEPMRRMVASILGSPVPVVLYVSPAGARAASAGVFLMAASTVAAMAPDTTIGSASPVGPGGGTIEGTLYKKIRNELTSLVRGMALSHGRNADWYRRFVVGAENLTAAEAVRNRVVEYLATDRDDLFAQIGKRGLPVPGGRMLRFAPADVALTAYDPGWRYGLLSWLLDPQMAYILLLVGVAGVFFELITPGAILPGVLGGLCLLPALYALSLLPVNAVGLLLLVFAGALFLLEVYVTSYGLLGLAGAAALFTGSVLLFRRDGHAGLPLGVIAPTVVGVSLLLFLAGWLLARAQRLRPRSGLDAMVGQWATVRHFDGPSGKVFINGEIWNASLDPGCAGCVPVPGQRVRIVAARDMVLVVTTDATP